MLADNVTAKKSYIRVMENTEILGFFGIVALLAGFVRLKLENRRLRAEIARLRASRKEKSGDDFWTRYRETAPKNVK